MKFIHVLLIVVFLASCSSKTTYEPKQEYPTDYQLIHVGLERTYQIDSIYYNDFTSKIDSTIGIMVETVTDSFIDESGKLSYLAYRNYKRLNASAFTPNASIVYAVTPKVFERVENNKRVVLINQPIYENKKWVGNPYSITPDDFPFYFSKVENPFSTKFSFYSNTITVVQNEELNFIQDIYADEVYAKKIGLVKREYRNIETQNNKPKGYKIVWQLKSII